VTAAPIVWAGAGLFWRGEYVTPLTFWRSAPKGIDLATVFLGNPLNGWWGASVRRDYGRFGINVVESTGWLGVVPMVLTAWVLSRATGARSRSVAPPAVQVSQSTSGSTQAVYRWSAVGLVFFVWALGPHLTVFGVNTGMPLPQALLRYVPIVANARIPGRAMVMVYLALSVLSAMAISKRHLWRQPVLVLSLVVVILIADFLPAPFPPMTPRTSPFFTSKETSFNAQKKRS